MSGLVYATSSSYVCHGVGHSLTCSGLAYLEVSSEVRHDSFCQLGNSVSLSWVVCREAFCLHVVSSSSCIPVVYLEPVLFLILLQCVSLFCNLSKCILLFFSYVCNIRIKWDKVVKICAILLPSSRRYIYQLTNQLTNCVTPWSRVLLEKLTGSQLDNELLAFYGTRRFITAFKRPRLLSLLWDK